MGLIFEKALRQIGRKVGAPGSHRVASQLWSSFQSAWSRPHLAHHRVFHESEVRLAFTPLKSIAVISTLDESRGELFFSCPFHFRYLLLRHFVYSGAVIPCQCLVLFRLYLVLKFFAVHNWNVVSFQCLLAMCLVQLSLFPSLASHNLLAKLL